MGRRTPGLDPRSFDRFYSDPLLGIDEVGMGALAGPICVAGVVLPRDPHVRDLLSDAGLRDSKEMTAKTRERVSKVIHDHAVWSRVSFAWCWEVEEQGHHGALVRLVQDTMTYYIRHFGTSGDILLDGNPWEEISYQYTAVRKGDQKSQTIAAASVIAKVARDNLMIQLSEEYPGYDFHNNVGYGTRAHLKGLRRLGPCEIHRQNVKPVQAAEGVRKKTFRKGWKV